MGSGMVTGLTGSEGEESSCSRMEAGVENRWSKIREILFCRVFHLILRLCHVLTIHRRCPANRRQWADFLDLLRDVNTIFDFFCIRNRPDYSGLFLIQLYYILIYFYHSCIIDLQKLI